MKKEIIMVALGIVLLIVGLVMVFKGVSKSEPTTAIIGLGIAVLAGVCFR
jgi:uncharacterized membrane protein HdeD (DUF308 family)